ncbi:TIGR01458 family HAD-type hydrolase [Gilvimarinus agarilyticus]|uniref:TIGR01458 family HAD-type hydrolase n=1 Tax=Gilvimarinus agarilyticus TaxID=679259 RepID=UPI00059FFE97|nr:TIGR01458 family HAD-type hydrolase [Gilvimarinus agarilyticus]
MAIKAIFFDLSGVIYDGDSLLPGALDTLAFLRAQHYTLRFVTNTATKSREQILTKLQNLGVSLAPSELFTAPDAACAFVQQHQLKPFALVHPSIEPLFAVHSEPDCVVLGDAREALNYHNLNKAFRLLLKGCQLLVIGDNKYFRENGELSLDAGPFAHALQWAAGCDARVFGKPSADFFDQVVATTPYRAQQCLMVGDDVLGDVGGAREAGLQSVLVATGKYRPGDEATLTPAATLIPAVAEVTGLL